MILAIAEGIRDHMLARGYPVRVLIDDAHPAVVRVSHTIVIERDRESDERFAVVGSARNPGRIYARYVGYVISAYAREPRAGAPRWEHDAECDRIVDGALVALRDWCVSTGAGEPEIVGGRMLPHETVDSAAPLSGYRVQVRVGRSVSRRDYDGSADPTATLAGVESTTRVSINGTDYEEIA